MFMRDMFCSKLLLFGGGCAFLEGNVGKGLSRGTFFGATGLKSDRSKPATTVSTDTGRTSMPIEPLRAEGWHLYHELTRWSQTPSCCGRILGRSTPATRRSASWVRSWCWRLLLLLMTSIMGRVRRSPLCILLLEMRSSSLRLRLCLCLRRLVGVSALLLVCALLLWLHPSALLVVVSTIPLFVAALIIALIIAVLVVLLVVVLPIMLILVARVLLMLALLCVFLVIVLLLVSLVVMLLLVSLFVTLLLLLLPRLRLRKVVVLLLVRHDGLVGN
jgi:hypothetical protein